MVALDQRTLVEGYRLQEKDAKVRLALDWALYRMGKNEALFSIVKELESSRQSQAVGYLSQLESPQPLYVFIGRGKPEMQVGLLEVFARLGDEETLNVVKNYIDSPYLKVAKAAERARDQISFRLAQKPLEEKTRARRAEAPARSEYP
jgi:HEAT repeat protein